MIPCDWPGPNACDLPGCPRCAKPTCEWDCDREATTERDGRLTCRQHARGFDESQREDMREQRVVEYDEEEQALVAGLDPGVRAYFADRSPAIAAMGRAGVKS